MTHEDPWDTQFFGEKCINERGDSTHCNFTRRWKVTTLLGIAHTSAPLKVSLETDHRDTLSIAMARWTMRWQPLKTAGDCPRFAAQDPVMKFSGHFVHFSDPGTSKAGAHTRSSFGMSTHAGWHRSPHFGWRFMVHEIKIQIGHVVSYAIQCDNRVTS